jgi:ABC-type multidrug transport system fused ATPase/permease subunit
MFIGLHELRSRIGVIPQDPLFFEGTIRTNMDPFGEYSDSDIWAAFEEVGMKDYIVTLAKKLQTHVDPGGHNFSAGYRQLFSIARVFLKRPRILVMDEVIPSPMI